MMRIARDIALVALAGLLVTGCATRSAPSSTPVAVRAHAPVKYEATVNSYFDFVAPPVPGPRKLAFGTPEASPCAIYGGGGRHASWVVPVIYDTSPPMTPTPAQPVASVPAKAAVDKNVKPVADKNGKVAAKPAAPVVKTSTSGTAPAPNPGVVSLNEVSITGIRYFFWFSSETLSAVTRQADLCP